MPSLHLRTATARNKFWLATKASSGPGRPEGAPAGSLSRAAASVAVSSVQRELSVVPSLCLPRGAAARGRSGPRAACVWRPLAGPLALWPRSLFRVRRAEWGCMIRPETAILWAGRATRRPRPVARVTPGTLAGSRNLSTGDSCYVITEVRYGYLAGTAVDRRRPAARHGHPRHAGSWYAGRGRRGTGLRRQHTDRGTPPGRRVRRGRHHRGDREGRPPAQRRA